MHSCTWQLEDRFSNNISAQPAHLDPESEILSPWRFSENLADISYDYNYHPILIKVQIQTIDNSNSVENQVSSQNTKNSFQNNDMNEQPLKYTSAEKPNIKSMLNIKKLTQMIL